MDNPAQNNFNINNDFINKIKTPLIYGTFGIVMFILICITIGLIYSKSGESSTQSRVLSQEENTTAVMVVVFISAILLIVFMVIPNYKEFLHFLGKLKFVLLLIGYIIGLIILFRDVPRNILDGYAFIFFPVTMLIGIYLFYLAMEKGKLYGFDLNYERIKYALIYFCLIIFMLVFYTLDPGGYLKTYFGPSLVISILLAIFGFLYLITLMTLPTLKPDANANANGVGATGVGGFFKGISRMGLYSGSAFIIFLILVVAGILAYPGGFTSGTNVSGSDKTNKVSLIVILLIVIFILWILFFGIISFSNTTLRNSDGNIDTSMKNITDIARNVFMLLFGLIFSGLLIGWLVTGVNNLSSTSGIISFILNFLIISAVLAIVFKLITGGTYYKKSPLFRLIVNTVLYIPCILVSIIDTLVSLIGYGGKTGVFGTWEATKNTPYTYYILLFFIIFLYILYYLIVPHVSTNIAKQGGTLLVNNPVYTNSQNVIGDYDYLNGTNADIKYDYQYAISFWVYIDAMSPNISSSLNTYTSLLNYGGKPNVLYNASENTLIVTMLNTGEPATGSASGLTDPQTLDAHGNIIIYKMTNVLLQKWNHIIINYNGGTLDIFYNGKLVKSVNEVVPRMTKDTLTIGATNGVNGGICNVTYFNTNLTASQVYYLYNIVKDKTPPVSSSSKESIVKNVPRSASINTNPVTVIPITLNVKSKIDSLEKITEKYIPEDLKNQPYTDYLSFKWFAVANNDNYNGL